MHENRFSRRYFFYGTLLAGAVPAGGFGSTPSLSALGYKSYNEKLNIAAIGVGTRGPAILQGAAPTENIVALCDVDDDASSARIPDLPQGEQVQRLPEDARKGGQEHRCRDDRHSGPHAYPHRAAFHAARQARLLREAADPHRVGSAAAGRRRGEVQNRNPDGQPGVQPRGHENGVRDPLVGRYRRGSGSARVDRRHLWRPAEPSRDRTGAAGGAGYARLGPLAGARGAQAVQPLDDEPVARLPGLLHRRLIGRLAGPQSRSGAPRAATRQGVSRSAWNASPWRA